MANLPSIGDKKRDRLNEHSGGSLHANCDAQYAIEGSVADFVQQNIHRDTSQAERYLQQHRSSNRSIDNQVPAELIGLSLFNSKKQDTINRAIVA